MHMKRIVTDPKKFMVPLWGEPQVNPVERAAATPGVPKGWPMELAAPPDRWYFFNGGWVDLKDIDAACKGWKKGDPIDYVRSESPDFSLPGYEGERYEAMVPDTLDIQERAALGINALTELTDPEADYEIYFDVLFGSVPPVMVHDEADNCQPKFEEALVLCRLISGNRQNMHVEEKWLETLFKMQGSDGLLYWPVGGRPWFTVLNSMGWPIPAAQAACPLEIGRFLSAITAYYRLTGDDIWLQTGKRVTDGLRGIALDVEDYAYHPKWYFDLGELATPAMINEKRYVPHLHGAGWVLDGIGKFYQATGYGPAEALGQRLSRYLIKRLSNIDNLHWHTNTQSLIGILDMAMATEDQDAAAFAEEHFELLKSWGNVTLGFFPESLGPIPYYLGAETCAVAGMIVVGLKLSEMGVADHWDDVDRWVRNQFAEAQLQRSDWILQRPMWNGICGPEQSKIDERFVSSDRVVERVLGSFAPGPTPNDWAGVFLATEGCCTGNGNRAWYHIWENILHYDAGALKINLLLNRASKWADVDSHIPNTGQVDVKVKQPVVLSIRIPEWVKPNEVRIRVNGKDRTVRWNGRYARVGDVQPADVVTMTFPIFERATSQWVQGHRYNMVIKGNSVVSIHPNGDTSPFYLRNHYRVHGTRWRKIERFVADKTIYH